MNRYNGVNVLSDIFYDRECFILPHSSTKSDISDSDGQQER